MPINVLLLVITNKIFLLCIKKRKGDNDKCVTVVAVQKILINTLPILQYTYCLGKIVLKIEFRIKSQMFYQTIPHIGTRSPREEIINDDWP